MMVGLAAGTDKCALICPLSGLNLGNEDKSAQQQLVTSSALSRLSPSQGQGLQRAATSESLANG